MRKPFPPPEHTRLTISHLAAEGDGVASFDNKRIYVPFTLPQEDVEIEIQRQRKDIKATALRIANPHAARQKPPCPHFGMEAETACGGCRMQHVTPEFYTQWKRDNAIQIFEKAKLKFSAPAIFVTPPATRRRAAFSANKRMDKAWVGFHARDSHRLINLESCAVLSPNLAALLQPLQHLCDARLHDGDKINIHVTTCQGRVEVTFLGHVFSADDECAIADWAIQHHVGAVYSRAQKQGERIILESAPLIAHYGNYSVTLPPASFLQASEEAEKAMLDFIRPHMQGINAYADLFCGSGLFSLSFATPAHIILASDLNGPSLKALRKGGHALPHLTVAERNLFAEPFTASDLKNYEAILIDPPRSGAEAQCAELAKGKTGKIIYISCNPQSFARDARLLQDSGYIITALKFFDQFLWSAHLECVAVFERR